MATSLTCLLLFSVSVSTTYAGIAHLQSQNKLMYVGSRVMTLNSTQKLCKSLGGELPVMKNYDQDLETMRKLTYEPVWLGVTRMTKPEPLQDYTKPIRRYTWLDGTTMSDKMIEEIPRYPCNTSCCSLRLRPDPSNTAMTEVNCNSTLNLPLCVVTLTSVNMAKILAASDVFTEDKDKLGIAMYVLPKLTNQMYDKVEGHRKTTHPILYVLLAVCLSALLVIAVMVIIQLRGNGPRRSPRPSPDPVTRKENGQQVGDGREEEGTPLQDRTHANIASYDEEPCSEV